MNSISVFKTEINEKKDKKENTNITLTNNETKTESRKSRKKKSEVRPGEELDKHRQNARQVLLHSNATPIRAYQGIGYCCCFCNEQFPNPCNLKVHTLEDHDEKTKSEFKKGSVMSGYSVKLDITGLKCKICDTNIETLELLLEHLKITHNKSIHTDIKNHILPFKFEKKGALKCFMCEAEFHRFKSLLEHTTIHYKNYICDTCNAGFVNRKLLRIHLQGHETGNFKCKYCKLVFETLPKRSNHERTVHRTMNMYKCGYCNERFNSNRRKFEHLSIVHGIQKVDVKCQACDKKFSNVRGLKIHWKRYHLMEKNYKCTECMMGFFSVAELGHHMVKHTGEKQFQCEICLKSYSRKKTLTEHMRIHNNDRRFKCEHCGQAFVQKCSWKGHMRSKHGEDV